MELLPLAKILTPSFLIMALPLSLRTVQVKALSKSKAVRFDHVIWHKAV